MGFGEGVSQSCWLHEVGKCSFPGSTRGSKGDQSRGSAGVKLGKDVNGNFI